MGNHIIDRRQNGRNHSAENRQKFLRRQKGAIKEAVKDAIESRDIKDMGKDGTTISVKKKSIAEPRFNQDPSTGDTDRVHPGNKEFIAGDTIKKPEGREGGGGGDASDSGEGEDDFIFQITKEEFLQYFFEDLELPNMIKTDLTHIEEYQWKRAGFSSVGIPTNLDVVRSMRQSIGRRIALRGPHSKKIAELQMELEKIASINPQTEEHAKQIADIEEQIAFHARKKKAVPFLDDIDLKYRLHTKEPIPVSSAVIFCIMDVSGSMTSHHKDLAKRFFTLLYLFLHRNYERVDIRFIRHHTTAKEVDEHEFFYSRETGGTLVSTAAELVRDIIKDEYTGTGWNVYIAQASDGDNWQTDNNKLIPIIKSLLNVVQYFAYIEVVDEDSAWGHSGGPSDLWNVYKDITHERMAMTTVSAANEIYPVFRKLFAKEHIPED